MLNTNSGPGPARLSFGVVGVESDLFRCTIFVQLEEFSSSCHIVVGLSLSCLLW